MEKKRGTGKSIVNGALSLTVSALIVKALGLIYKVPLSYVLSDVGMGYFNSAYTVFTFFYIICTAGVPKAISILVTKAESEGDRDLVRATYKTSFLIFFAFGALFSIIFILAAGPIASLIGNSGAKLTMLAVAPSIAFVCASGVLRGYFAGTLNFIPIAISELVSGVFRALVGLLLAFVASACGADYTVISGITILGTTLGSVFSFLFLLWFKNRNKREVKLKHKPIVAFSSRKIFKEILTIATPLTLTSAIASIGSLIDLFIIMRSLQSSGYSEFEAGILYGNYTTLAIPILNLIITLVAPLSAVMLPLVSNPKINSDKVALSNLITSMVDIVLIISVPASFFLLFESYAPLSVLFEDTSAILAAPMLKLLAPGIVFMCLATLLNTALEGVGKPEIPLIALIVATVIKLIVTVVLIKNDSFGILGAPIGTTVSYFISAIIASAYLTLIKKVKIRMLRTGALSLLSSLVAYGIYYFINMRLSSKTTFTMLLVMFMFVLIYALLVYVLGILRPENLKKMAKYTN